MTVITKPSALINKPKISNTLLVEKNACEEEKVDIHGRTKANGWLLNRMRRTPTQVLYLSALFFIMVLLVITLLIYHSVILDIADQVDKCSILVPNGAKEKAKHDSQKQVILPLLQTVRLISTRSEAASAALADALREDLDIRGSFEKISVITNGRLIDFIHDFDDNTTTIVDKERCFVMQLKPDWVLPPGDFLAALRRGDALDVSRERRRLRAAPAPAAPAAPATPAACAALPAYWLQPDDGLDVHKRSVEGAADAGAQFVHFAGRRVQEIHITNLPELLRREAAPR